jgi:hypothetical protein
MGRALRMGHIRGETETVCRSELQGVCHGSPQKMHYLVIRDKLTAPPTFPRGVQAFFGFCREF